MVYRSHSNSHCLLSTSKSGSLPKKRGWDWWFGFGVEALVLVEGKWETTPKPQNHQLEGSGGFGSWLSDVFVGFNPVFFAALRHAKHFVL